MKTAACPGYEGLYLVSETGEVSRLAPARGTRSGLVLRQCVDGRGYACVGLRKLGKQARRVKVHRLVCEAFNAPPPAARPYVNHKDGVKLNNRADNLEWVSAAENAAHAHRTGLASPCRGAAHPKARAVARVNPTTGEQTTFTTIKDACAATPGARRDRVWEAATPGKRLKNHAGFAWRFI